MRPRRDASRGEAASKPVWKKLGNDLVGDKVMSRLEEIGQVKK
jgi:hypothetical protein